MTTPQTTSPTTEDPGLADRIADLVAGATGLDRRVVAEAGGESLTDLGLDSLAVIEIQETVKDEYQVVIPEEDAPLMSIPEIVAFVAARLAEAS